MTVEKKYYIRVRESLVEVTQEVYTAFYHAKRQERTQMEKEQRNRVISYDAWDSETYIGQELLTIPDGINVEDAVIAALMSEKLHRCLELLPKPEQRIIQAVYFDGKSEAQAARDLDVPLMTLRYRKNKILKKLKKMLDQ